MFMVFIRSAPLDTVIFLNILEPLYKRVQYKTVFYIRLFIGNSKSVVSKQKCIDYIEKRPFMVIFLYNLYIFTLIKKQKCIDYTDK